MSEASRIGAVLAGKYRLDAELGRGGMGAVYRAYHLRVHKDFAVKLLHTSVKSHRSISARFFLEAQAAGRIGHPGILDVYDVGEDEDGSPFLVMELLRGEPLASLVRRARLDVDAACWIAAEVLEILSAAHAAKVIHRDIKPQNVFLTDDRGERRVKILDFGIAKFDAEGSVLTRSGEIIGSPLYMSPEQAKGEAELDPRADLWSVGAMLFEMLTGACAHTASTPVAVLAKILTVPAPPPSTVDRAVPPELDAIVGKALAIDRDDRYPSATAMREALKELLVRRGVTAAPKLPAADPRPGPADATPIAISSTVTAGPDATPVSVTPGSASPPSATPKSSKASASARSGPSPSNAPGARSRIAGIAVAVLAALVLIPWYVHFASRRSPTSEASTAASSSRAATSEAESFATSAALPVASGPPSSVSGTAATASSVASAPPSASSSSPPSAASAVRPPPRVPGTLAPAAHPACAAGEVVSRGHCCPRGLEWQGTRCERPLATEF